MVRRAAGEPIIFGFPWLRRLVRANESQRSLPATGILDTGTAARLPVDLYGLHIAIVEVRFRPSPLSPDCHQHSSNQKQTSPSHAVSAVHRKFLHCLAPGAGHLRTSRRRLFENPNPFPQPIPSGLLEVEYARLSSPSKLARRPSARGPDASTVASTGPIRAVPVPDKGTSRPTS
jgi:hypothetical protein